MGKALIGKGDYLVLLQDNDPNLIAIVCRKYIEKKEREDLLQIMTWATQSPDSNPIELLWEDLDCNTRNHCPTSEINLWDLLQDSWKNLTNAVLEKLVMIVCY